MDKYRRRPSGMPFNCRHAELRAKHVGQRSKGRLAPHTRFGQRRNTFDAVESFPRIRSFAEIDRKQSITKRDFGKHQGRTGSVTTEIEVLRGRQRAGKTLEKLKLEQEFSETGRIVAPLTATLGILGCAQLLFTRQRCASSLPYHYDLSVGHTPDLSSTPSRGFTRANTPDIACLFGFAKHSSWHPTWKRTAKGRECKHNIHISSAQTGRDAQTHCWNTYKHSAKERKYEHNVHSGSSQAGSDANLHWWNAPTHRRNPRCWSTSLHSNASSTSSGQHPANCRNLNQGYTATALTPSKPGRLQGGRERQKQILSLGNGFWRSGRLCSSECATETAPTLPTPGQQSQESRGTVAVHDWRPRKSLSGGKKEAKRTLRFDQRIQYSWTVHPRSQASACLCAD